MSDTIIQVENLGKKYLIQHQTKDRYTSLRDVLTRKSVSFSRKIFIPYRRQQLDSSREEFWALKDVTFDIKRGEVVGFIGRNGAGKSTLLKVLARITEPTTGRVQIKGRVASLLEVGTGFHPELTGRENIFLNGAILGMGKEEIRRKFDEIVDFAEVEKFLDTPVKRYSSGMYVRLAFAVAAHLEPEILLIDEVLAVGDSNFQKKCLGKLENVSKSGRTVLFVSHNLVAVRQLCNRVILLDGGCVVLGGEPDKVAEKYLSSSKFDDMQHRIADMQRIDGHGEKIRILSCELISSAGHPTHSLKFGEPFELQIRSRVIGESELNDISVVVGIDSGLDFTRIASCASEESDLLFSVEKHDLLSLKVRFEKNFLSPGRYYFTVVLRTGRYAILDRIPQCLKFEILDIPHEGIRLNTFLAGYLRLQAQWHFQFRSQSVTDDTQNFGDNPVIDNHE